MIPYDPHYLPRMRSIA